MITSVRKTVDEKVLKYDPQVGLIKDFTTPNYHSNLKEGEYFRINDSTLLAAAIFSCEYEKYYDMANTLLKSVCALQRKEGELLGLWPYFYEEGLEEMVAPDWNMADFNAYPMLFVLKEHKDKLKSDVAQAMKEACINAVKAIMKRNLTVIYTNPTVMGVYCSVVCGELFGIKEFIDYGSAKLDKFYFRIMNAGTYDEYNCPGYSMLIANIYAIALRHIENGDMLKKINDLNRLVWTMLGEHFHIGLSDFTGPNLRQYTNFYAGNIDTLMGKKAGLMSLVYKTECPEDIKPLFLAENKTEEFRRILSTGYLYPYLAWPQVDTQFIRPKYTLGSNSMSDCWNQRRNVVAYIGDKDKKVCIRLRTYHDDYDFASAFTTTAQQGGTAISFVNFHTNRGDTHVDLDPIQNATFKAYDLRVKYQIEANCGGVIDEIKYEAIENGCKLNIMGVPVEITYPFMEMTGEKPYFQIGRVNDNEMFVDAVFYCGEEKEINLKKLDSLCAVAVIKAGENIVGEPVIEKNEEVLTATLKANGVTLKVGGAYKPLKQASSVVSNFSFIDEKDIVKVAQDECH